MRKAIDNYAQGKQREVEAWAGSSISASSGRFICPECLERVALDIRGHFRHKNRTAQSIECEKRVDSATRTAHERMGLPLYLCQNSERSFSLGIGFNGHDEATLDKAENAKAYLEVVDSYHQPIRYNISYAKFIPNRTSIIPINYLPSNNGSFQIVYSENTPQKLKSIWTNRTDVWGVGQFFKIAEQYSRKVRSLGTIVTDEDYYFVGSTWTFNRFTSFVAITECGDLKLLGTSLRVHRIRIMKSRATESQFDLLASLLRERYKVNLLVGESLIYPVWPPCIEEDDRMVYPNSTATIHLLVQSQNESPSIYRYYGGEYVRDNITGEYPFTYRISATNDEIPLCVDRAFNGNIQFVCRKVMNAHGQKLLAEIIDDTGESVETASFRSLSKKRFSCLTNFPAIVHLKGVDRDVYREIKSIGGLMLDNCRWGDTISIYNRSGTLILRYTFRKKTSLSQNEEDCLVPNVKNCCSGPLVEITPQVLAMYKSLDNKTVRVIVSKYIKRGSIPKALLNLLMQYYRRK